MPLHVRDGGAWKEVQKLWVRDAGSWKEVSKLHIRDGGAWKETFVAEAPPGINVTAYSNCDPIEEHGYLIDITPSYSAQWRLEVQSGESWSTVDTRTTGSPYQVDFPDFANTTLTFRVWDLAKSVDLAVQDSDSTGPPCP
jgi:hypothetical protein